MKLKVLVIVFAVVLAFSGCAYARSMTVATVTESTGDTDIAVASTATVYTSWFRVDRAEYFSVAYWVYSSAGSTAVTIQLEQSWTAPTTDGSADSNYVIPVSMADIATALATESTWYIKSLSPVPMPYARFKLTGSGSNNADTIARIKVGMQLD